MRRILEAELDANFFQLGQAALKSFLKYNPGWELHVCDLGLTAAQREELSTVGLVELRPAWEQGRWPQAVARMECLAKLCLLPDTLILHLDADTLTFGSVAPMVAELQRADASMMLTPMQSPMSHWLFSLAKTREVFERPEEWYEHHCYNAGVMVMKATEQLADMFAQASKKYVQYRGMFPSADQSVLVAELLDRDITILDMPSIYNFSPVALDPDGIALFNPPLLADGTELVIVHIPVPKLLVFTAGASLASIGWWWRRWLDHYEEEPWPTLA